MPWAMTLALPLLASLLAASPQVGEKAPDFTATDTDGHTVTLSQAVKDGPVIVAFFPKAFTGGCTRELAGYTERHAEVAERKARVLAVSLDDRETLARFKAELKAPYAFLPDPEAKLATLYGVKAPDAPVAQRTTFVVGERLEVLRVDSGKDALDPGGAIAACPLRKKAAAKAGGAK